mmetsp:Transcript_42647/g.56318  ORF Transcript_42647/g.56318 Transcript_42647/m.56318 type:complete len:90 (-) Transcript_42647:1240-1509(-)
MKDVQYEIQSVRDIQLRTEKVVEANHSELLGEIEALKTRITSLEDQINALKKTIGLLDDKMRNMGKAAAMSGNSAMAGNLLDDMEKAIA